MPLTAKNAGKSGFSPGDLDDELRQLASTGGGEDYANELSLSSGVKKGRNIKLGTTSRTKTTQAFTSANRSAGGN